MRPSCRFAYTPAASSLHDSAAVDRILSGLEETLIKAGGVRTSFEEAPPDKPLLHVVLTGGTERLILDRLKARSSRCGKGPVVLVAHPAHNSLAASLEILARVRLEGGVGRIVMIEGDAGGIERVHEAAHLADVSLLLRQARLGAIGEPSEWLVASSHSASLVRDTWGPELIGLSTTEFGEPALSRPNGRVAVSQTDAALSKELISRSARCEVERQEVERASAVYRALESMIAEHRLWWLTVRCFELVTAQRTTACLALSQLADEGIPAGCEGDVPAAIALLWVHLLTADAAWMANPAHIDPERGELVLAHCTVPRTMVRSYDLQTHFESGHGVAIAGEIAPGPTTLVRLGGEKLECVWMAEGELIRSQRVDKLCRTQALVKMDGNALEELLERPLGNHIVLLPGHRAKLLRASREMILVGAASCRP